MSLAVDVQRRVRTWAPPRADITAWASLALGRRAAGRELGVRVVGPGESRRLNARYRGRDKPTNVLSFPMGDPAPAGDPDFPWLIGDIVMSFDTMKAEAERDGKVLEHHVVHLAVHAALHLIGHDHEDEAEAEAMEAAEIALLAGLGIADPYADSGDNTGDSP